MAKLTTHVLDISTGLPAAGMRVSLFREGELVATALTNEDGRCAEPLLEGEDFGPGGYELVFAVGDYFAAEGVESPFLDEVPVRFKVAERGGSYHVPLLCSPWAYSTYRGS